MAVLNIHTNAATTTSGIDPTMSFYHRELLTRAGYKKYYSRWADSVSLARKSGKTIIMRRYAHLAMALSPLAEGVPPAGQVPTLTDYSAVVSFFGDFIALSDYMETTGIDDYKRHWAGLLGDQAGYTMDAIDRDVVTAGTTVIYTNGAARNAVLSPVDGNDLDRAIRALSNAGAETTFAQNSGTTTVGSSPVLAAYPAVTLPDVMFDIQNLNGFRWATEYKGAAEGEVGRYKKLAFFESPDPSSLNAGGKKFIDSGAAVSGQVKSTGGSNADVYTIMIFGKHGFTNVPLNSMSTKTYTQKPGGISDPLEQVMTFGWKNGSSRLITNQSWLCRIECAASV